MIRRGEPFIKWCVSLPYKITLLMLAQATPTDVPHPTSSGSTSSCHWRRETVHDTPSGTSQ